MKHFLRSESSPACSDCTAVDVPGLQDESPVVSAPSVLPQVRSLASEADIAIRESVSPGDIITIEDANRWADAHGDATVDAVAAGNYGTAEKLLKSRASRSPVAPAGASGLLTVSQVASLLEVSPQRVRQMIASGQLKARKINPRLFLVRRGDVKYVARRPLGRPRS